MHGVRLQSIMRLVLHCHSGTGRALPAPDKGALRVSHKSQMVPTVTPLISHTEGDTECMQDRDGERVWGRRFRIWAVDGQRWRWKREHMDEERTLVEKRVPRMRDGVERVEYKGKEKKVEEWRREGGDDRSATDFPISSGKMFLHTKALTFRK